MDEYAVTTPQASGVEVTASSPNLEAQLHADLLTRISDMASDEYRSSEAYVYGPAMWRSVVFYAALMGVIVIVTAMIYLAA